MLVPRQLFAFSVVYAGVFAIAWVTASQLRPVVLALGFALVVIFAFQANLWHQYMDLKNRADFDMSSAISQRVLASPDYRPDLPLVIVGTRSPDNYLPFWRFNTRGSLLPNGSLSSVYGAPWSANRMLMFFFRFARPSAADIEAATAAAMAVPEWPTQGSVAIRDGRILVVLKRPEQGSP